MEYLFHLSGANKTLPGAEVVATLEALDVKFHVLHSYDQVLVVRAPGLKETPGRLALCHGIYEFLGVCEPRIRDILALAREAAPSLSPPIAVRIRRIRGRSRELRRNELEQQIGAAIDKEVNLARPRSLVVGFLAEKFLLGRRIHALGRDYSHRHPKTRPFFRPGVLLPRTARAAVNLTRIKPGEALMDPFCGTGGILIEAGLIGARVYGCDINPEVVEGCRVNLEHYGIKDHHLQVGDARVMGARYPNYFHAIATDPPYGISASTRGLTLENLYREAFNSFYEMLREGGYACVLAPMKLETEKYAAQAGFSVVETHYDRVHAGLTRKILVVRKWN